MHSVSQSPEPRRSDALSGGVEGATPFRRGLRRFTAAAAATAAAALALAALLSVSIIPREAAAAEVVHVVAKGQTLVAIAKRHRVTVEAIRAANNLPRWKQLHPGDELIIPEKGREAEAAKRAAEAKKPAKGSTAKEKGKPSEKGAEKENPKGRGKEKARAKESDRERENEKAVGYARKPKRPGFVHLQRGTEKFEGQLLTRNGRLVPAALSGVSRMLRFGPTGAKIPIDPRLATLIGIVSDHFGGRTIHVVSGYRPFSPRQHTRHSKHNVGHAMDFSVEGVPNTVVRDYCRTFRSSGVGYYPNSSFVHMDVRTSKVYWVDYSGPGEAPRYDSPHAQAAADESTDDVNAPETPETPGESGSKQTSPPESQGVDSTNENGSGRGLQPPPQRGPGNSDPSPAPTPAPEAPTAP
jgi:uncharacterized protein YcbK (DUF882 family)